MLGLLVSLGSCGPSAAEAPKVISVSTSRGLVDFITKEGGKNCRKNCEKSWEFVVKNKNSIDSVETEVQKEIGNTSGKRTEVTKYRIAPGEEVSIGCSCEKRPYTGEAEIILDWAVLSVQVIKV